MRYNPRSAAQAAAKRYGDKLVAQGYQRTDDDLYARGAERVSVTVLGTVVVTNEWNEDGTCPECGGLLGDDPVSIGVGYHQDENGTGGPCYRTVCAKCADALAEEE